MTPARPDRPGAERAPGPIASACRPLAGRVGATVALGAGSMACAVGLIATSAWLISRSAQRPQESALAVAIVAVQFFALGRGLLRYCERLAGHDAALRALTALQARLYERLERLAPAGLPIFRRGDLLARLVGDVDGAQDLILRVIVPWAIAIVVGAASVATVAAMLPAAGLVFGAALLLAATAVQWLTLRLARRGAARRARLRGELTAQAVDLLSGAEELVAYGALDGALARAGEADRGLAALAHADARAAGVGQGLTTLLAGLAMWGSLAVGVAALADGRLDGVLLAGLALIPLVAFELVAPLPAAAQSLQEVRGSGARLREVFDAPAPLPEDGRGLARLPSAPEHSLSLRGVRSSYPGREAPALDGVDLELPAGARVALLGPSGAGKSTVAWVLLRFLAYSAGSARIDGIELDTLDGESVRRAVGLIEQDPHIFDGTLAANLRLARPSAEDAELSAVLERVGLLEWAQGLPEGLETELGERGGRLSGGQRQRLALARALLADFQVLILDEPTEHVDPATAAALLEDLLAAASGRTTLLITHELGGLERFDEIALLEHGRIVERGTHAALLARGGSFARLWGERARTSSDPAA